MMWSSILPHHSSSILPVIWVDETPSTISVSLLMYFLLAHCREMIVVHTDEDFLEDIMGKLKEVCSQCCAH